MASILVLDNDPLQLRVVTVLLQEEGHRVHATPDADAALELLRSTAMDLVVMETALPRQDGFRLCQQIHSLCPTLPLIIMSHRAEEEDIVRGLLVAADDYIVKPFSPRQFLARVHALLRRMNVASQSIRLQEGPAIGEIVLNRQQMHAQVNGRRVLLTPRELSLLLTLMGNAGRVLSRHQLMELAWGHQFAGTARTIDVYVQRLRKKIEPHLMGRLGILAIRGFGYKFEVADARPESALAS